MMSGHAIQSPIGDTIADISSCLFHLCEASVLGSCAAALALGRLKYGIGTDILASLSDYVSQDTEAALPLLQLAAYRGSVAGACLSAQILQMRGGTVSFI
jgi:hypothetical protein